MDLGQRRLAGRRVVAALRRLHRRQPMRSHFRTDLVLAELRADAGERLPIGHRGGGSLAHVSDAELIDVLESLAQRGQLGRSGRHVWLPAHRPEIADDEMRARVDRLFAALREGGASPPRVDALASRLGVPPALLSQLRASGQLVQVADGIDYPVAVLAALVSELDELASVGPLKVAGVRDALRTSRRHAQSLLVYRAGLRAENRRRDSRQRRCPISRQ
jgi:hypothetical protein